MSPAERQQLVEKALDRQKQEEAKQRRREQAKRRRQEKAEASMQDAGQHRQEEEPFGQQEAEVRQWLEAEQGHCREACMATSSRVIQPFPSPICICIDCRIDYLYLNFGYREIFSELFSKYNIGSSIHKCRKLLWNSVYKALL